MANRIDAIAGTAFLSRSLENVAIMAFRSPARGGDVASGAAGRPAAAHPTEYLANVQIARFVAAALVLFGHVQQEVEAGKAGIAHGFSTVRPIDFGMGVDIFFIISGFIMAYLTRTSFGVPGAPGRFLIRRALRVAPIYYVFTTLLVAAAWLMPERFTSAAYGFAQIAASYGFIPWPGPLGVFPVLSLGWTLNYEMMFYAAFAAALLFPRRIGLAGLAVAFVALALCNRSISADQVQLKFWSDPIIVEFLLGVAIAELYLRGVRVGPGTGALMVAAGFAYAALLAGAEWRPSHRLFSIGPGAALIVAAAVLVTARPRISWAERQFAVAGDASYALYLSHPFSIKLLSLVWIKAGLPAGWSFVVLACLAAITVSVAVHFTLERWLGRLGAALIRRPRAVAGGATA